MHLSLIEVSPCQTVFTSQGLEPDIVEAPAIPFVALKDVLNAAES